MKNILLIDNFDSFTFNLVDFFETAGAKLTIFRNDIPVSDIDPEKYDLLCISPGPSIPKNAGNLMGIIGKCATKIPIFGVCLGHEALAEYFGGSLKFVAPVHGKSSAIYHDGKTIFEGISNPFPGGRYHSLAVDKMPEGFIVSAKTVGEHPLGRNISPNPQNISPHGDIIMAMRHKSLPIESVQFHPESVLTMKNSNGMKLVENVLSVL